MASAAHDSRNQAAPSTKLSNLSTRIPFCTPKHPEIASTMTKESRSHTSTKVINITFIDSVYTGASIDGKLNTSLLIMHFEIVEHLNRRNDISHHYAKRPSCRFSVTTSQLDCLYKANLMKHALLFIENIDGQQIVGFAEDLRFPLALGRHSDMTIFTQNV